MIVQGTQESIKQCGGIIVMQIIKLHKLINIWVHNQIIIIIKMVLGVITNLDLTDLCQNSIRTNKTIFVMARAHTLSLGNFHNLHPV